MSGTTPGKIDVGEVFRWTLDAALRGIKQGVIQEGAKTKAVQKEIESQKTVAGKNILWNYFPYFILGGVGLFMLAKVK